MPGHRSAAHRAGRHAARGPRSRRRWQLVVVLAAASALVGGTAMASSITRSIDYMVTAPVTVQALGLDAAAPAIGQPVSAGAKVVAERNQTFDYVVLAVRDAAGRNVDFPGTPRWSLGSTQRVYTSTRAFDRAGTYTYWFAYHSDGRWTNLSPRRTFTVTAGGAGT